MPKAVMDTAGGPLMPKAYTDFMEAHPRIHSIVDDLSLSPVATNISSGEMMGPGRRAIQKALGAFPSVAHRIPHPSGDVMQTLVDYAHDPNTLVPLGFDAAGGPQQMLGALGGAVGLGQQQQQTPFVGPQQPSSSLADSIRRALQSK